MERTISATEARVHFGRWMRHVSERGESVVVERAGKPVVVLVAAREYERLRALGEGRPGPGALAHLEAFRARILARRGGEPLPPPEDVIGVSREERGRELAPVR